MMFEKIVKSAGDWLYLLARLLVGFFIASHGLGKLMQGFIGPGDIAGFAGFAGVPVFVAYLVALGEIAVGVGIFLGLWTRLAALGGIVIMLGAWFMVHFQNSLNPYTNGMELPSIFLASFLLFFIFGNGKYALEGLFAKKEAF